MQNYSSFHNNGYNSIDIGSYIDAKIAQNNQIILREQNDTISQLSTQIETHDIRISSLETLDHPRRNSIRKRSTETNQELEENSDEETEDLEATIKRKAYREDIEVDTFMYLTLAFALTSVYLIPSYFKIIFGLKNLNFSQRFNYFCTVISSPLILIPGLATMLIQLYCVYYVYYEALATFSTMDKWSYMALKIILLVIFLFMVAKEVSQAINSFFYAVMKTKNLKYFFYSLCFLPPLIQMSMGFIILFVGFLLIASTDDPINLIQNFASVYVLLEIDNIMMDFIKMSKLSLCINSINSKLDILRREMGAIEIFNKRLMMKLMVEETLEMKYIDSSPTFKKYFMVTRMVCMVLLFLFAVAVYVFEIVLKPTSS